MTFEPDIIELFPEHLNELAKLIHETGVSYILFTGSEITALFDIDAKAKDLQDFEYNIRGTFFMGTISENTKIISPAVLLSEPLPENNWFEYAATAAVLNYIRNRLGDDALLNKLQVTFSNEFDYLSTGQAKSVIKRYLGLALNSTERNDIYRIRKKFEGYQKLIDAFYDKLAVNRSRIDRYVEQDRTVPLPTDEELLEKITQKLAFMCWECRQYAEFPESSLVDPPVHHDKPMTLNWNVSRPLDEIQSSIQELKSAISNPSSVLKSISESDKVQVKGVPEGFPKLYCDICREYVEIDDDLQKQLDQSEHRISLPKHHNKEMQIVTYPVERLENLIKMGEKYNLISENLEAGLYYLCESCMLLVNADDMTIEEFRSKDVPVHHDRPMARLAKTGSNSRSQ